MGLGSEAVLYDTDGSPLAVDNGVATPSDTPLIMIGGSDGTNSRYITIDSSGRQVLVGAGTAGSPAGGIITIQGVSGGTAVPISITGTNTISGTVTANQGTAASLSGYWPVRITDGTNTMPTGDAIGRAVFYKLTDGTNTAAVTASSALKIDGSGVTQPVSGTVTANAGSGNFSVVQATASNLLASVGGLGASGSPTVGNPVLVAGSDGTNTRSIRTASDGTVRVDPTGTTTQPISGTVTANIGTTGGLALDSTLTKLTISPGTAVGSNTLAMVGGSVTTAAPTYTNGNINPLSLTTTGALRIDGSGVTQPISGTVSANQSGTWTVQQGTTGSGAAAPWSIELSDGSSFYTAAKTGQFPAALVGGRLDTNVGAWLGSTAPTVGQKAMANSIPVAIASDQSSVPITVSNFGVVVSTGNSTVTPLGSGATFTGTAESVTAYQEIDINIAGSPSNAPGTLYFEFSPDGTNWDVSIPVSLTGLSMVPQFLRVVLPWFRVRYVNGSTVQTTFRLTVVYHRTSAARLTRFLNQTIDNSEPVENVRAVLAGSRFNNSAEFINRDIDENVTDLDNKLLTGLTNGSILNFTTDFTTDIFTSTSHGLQDGYAVHLTTTGTLPAPLTASTVNSSGDTVETIYWVINSTANTFKLSTSPGGTAVNLTDNGTGTHSFQNRGQYVGLFKDVTQVGSVLEFFFSDVNPAVLRNEWSNDGVSINTDLLSISNISVQTFTQTGFGTFYLGLLANNTMTAPFYRVRIVNGPSNQGPLSGFYSFIGKNPIIGTVATLDSPLSLLSISQLVRSVTAGVTPDGYFKNLLAQGAHAGNSSTTPLPGNTGGSNHIFMGRWVNWQEDYAGLLVDVSADVSGTLRVEFSQLASPIDGYDTSITDFVSIPYNPSTTPFYRKHVPTQSKWVRIKYINGNTAQSMFSLDTAFTVSPTVEAAIPINTSPDSKILTAVSQSIVVAERSEVANSFVKVKTTTNNSKDSLNTNVTGVEDDVAQKPLEAAQARQFVVGATAVQLDTPVLSTPGKRRALGIQTRGGSWMAYGFSNSITFTGNSMILPPNSFKSIALDSGVNLWAICEQTGGIQTTFNLAGSSASGTATSPSNALTSNDTRATISAAGQTIRVTGVNYTPTASSTIQSVRIGCEARKQSGQFETVAFVDATTGNAGAVGSVTSASISSGTSQFVLVAISRETPSASTGTVSDVSGLGLTWTQTFSQSSDDTNRKLDVWQAYGNPTSGTVTATFATNPASSHIAVLRFSGADPTTPVQASGGTTANSSSVTGPTLAGTNKGLSFLAVAMDNTTSTPGAGYTERSDEKSASGTIDGLTTETKALTSTGNETATATLANSKHYAAVGVTISPSAAINPVVTLSYETPSGTAGSTSGNLTYSSTTDGIQFVDITGDRSWTESNVDNIVLIATGQTLSAATLEVDQLYVEVVDTTGNTVRVSVEQYASTS